MKLIVNGESKEVTSNKANPTLKKILSELNYHPQLVVVELNGEIINSKSWEDQILQDGDHLEIVTIVGGGY